MSHSPETRAKLAASLKLAWQEGRRKRTLAPETKEKIRAAGLKAVVEGRWKNQYTDSGYVPMTPEQAAARKVIQTREWRKLNPDRDAELQDKYHLKDKGLTVEKLKQMQETQNGFCAICPEPLDSGRRPNVDHDHKCCPGGKEKRCGNCNRGLLCNRCNLLLGMAGDNTEILQAAISYLNRYKTF